MPTTCRTSSTTHYLDSWNEDCGGSWWTFASRSLSILDAGFLAFLATTIYRRGGFLFGGFGAGLMAKSTNDLHEAWSGDAGKLREVIGDKAYFAIETSLIFYGLTRKVPKINYLGNPAKDFFVKDPLSYEYAFKQYSRLELFHQGASLIVHADNNKDKYANFITTEIAWLNHLERLEENAD